LRIPFNKRTIFRSLFVVLAITIFITTTLTLALGQSDDAADGSGVTVKRIEEDTEEYLVFEITLHNNKTELLNYAAVQIMIGDAAGQDLTIIDLQNYVLQPDATWTIESKQSTSEILDMVGTEDNLTLFVVYYPYNQSVSSESYVLYKETIFEEGEWTLEPGSTGGGFQASWWQSLLSLVPLIAVFFGILVLKLSSRYVAPIVLVVFTVPLALIAFSEGAIFGQIEKVLWVTGYSFSWGVFNYVYSIFGAFFFLAALKKAGALVHIKDDFKSITDDKQHLILLIGFCFAMILAVVAPAGSNFVIAAMMLLSLGFNRYGVGMLCLFGNSISSVYGLLGVAIVVLAEVTDLGLVVLSGNVALFMIFLTILTPLWMNIIYTKKGFFKDLKDKDLREDIILLLLMGGVFAGVQLATAWFLGPQLPTIMSGIATLIVIVIVEKTILRHRAKRYTKEEIEARKERGLSYIIKAKSYYIPFAIMIVLLIFTQLIVPNVGPLDWLFSLPSIPITFSAINKTVDFNLLTNPGTLVVLSTLSVPAFAKLWSSSGEEEEKAKTESKKKTSKKEKDEQLKDVEPTCEEYKCPNCDETVNTTMNECPICEEILAEDKEAYAKIKLAMMKLDDDGKKAKSKKMGQTQKEHSLLGGSFRTAGKTVLPILIAIGCFMAIANVMKYFNMTTAVAQGLLDIIDLLGGSEYIYVFCIPIIGMLGSGLTGSTSTSNALFGGLHMDMATKLGLSLPKVAAAQVLGSTTGEMISPMNAIVVAAAVGLKDKESILIKRMLPSFVLWLLICIASTFFFMYVF